MNFFGARSNKVLVIPSETKHRFVVKALNDKYSRYDIIFQKLGNWFLMMYFYGGRNGKLLLSY